MNPSDQHKLKAVAKIDVALGQVKKQRETSKPPIAPVGQRIQQAKPPQK